MVREMRIGNGDLFGKSFRAVKSSIAGKSVYWSRYEPKNFGDWITPYLYHRITGGEPSYWPPRYPFPLKTTLGSGSIMRHIRKANVAIVWGSGIISRSDKFERPYKILAVRGPKTRERCEQLGFECPDVYGDPAILLPLFYRTSNSPNCRLGIVPHFGSFQIAKDTFGALSEVKIIDVTQPLEKVVDEIASCEYIISSSLHGIIVSHAYGIRCGYVEFGEKLAGDGIKFSDYFLACGLTDERPTKLSLRAAHITEGLLSLARNTDLPILKGQARDLLKLCPFE